MEPASVDQLRYHEVSVGQTRSSSKVSVRGAAEERDDCRMERKQGQTEQGECAHTTCLVSRAPGGGLFFGRCLICGKTGPGRLTSETAREALVAEPNRDSSD